VKVTADQRELRRPDGRGVEFAADGIALSRDGRMLYWQAIKGRTLYRIPTADLHRALATPDQGPPLAAEPFGENGVADGLHIGRESGMLYITAVEDNAIKVRDLSGPATRPTILVQDRRLRWPDSIAEAPDGSLYVTTSRIQDSAMFNPTAPASLPTQLWRLDFAGR
jgi:sugar lactone lactonase YvrE